MKFRIKIKMCSAESYVSKTATKTRAPHAAGHFLLLAAVVLLLAFGCGVALLKTAV